MNHDMTKFKKRNAALIEKAERLGIDWQGLWAKFGPLVKMILEILLKGA
mgnify:CR=1 FL=1